MGSKNSKKNSSGTKNPERRSGKAWKQDKNKVIPKKTVDREIRDEEIRIAREERRQKGMARHAAEILRKAEALARLEVDRTEQQERDRIRLIQAAQEVEDAEKAEQARIDALSPSMRWMKSRTKGGRVIPEKTLSSQFLSA